MFGISYADGAVTGIADINGASWVTIVPKPTLELFAQWAPKTYTVTVDLRDGAPGTLSAGTTGDKDFVAKTITSGTMTHVVYTATETYGQGVASAIGLVVNKGYRLAGWDWTAVKDDGTTVSGSVTVDDGDANFGLSKLIVAGTVTAYAVFEQLSFVSYLPGDHGNWTATTTTGDTGAFFDDIRIGSSVPTFATGNDGLLVDVPGLGKQPGADDDSNWLFNGWRGSDGKVYPDYVIPTEVLVTAGGVTFTALWVGKDQTLTLNPNGGAFTNGMSGTITQIAKTDVVLPGTTDIELIGWILDGWSLSAGGSILYAPGATIKMPTAPTTLFAHWKQDYVEVSYEVKTDGTNYFGHITGPAGAGNGIVWVEQTVSDPRGAYVPSFADSAYDKLVNIKGTQSLSAVTGDALDPANLSNMLYAGPFTLTANAFDGYRFVRWVDENGNEVSTNASLLVGRDLASGRYEAHTYYAVFAELESVTIDYTVSNSNVVWVDFATEAVPPFPAIPRPMSPMSPLAT